MQVSMECNKDEALRSLGIAERKFLQHDLAGAKKFTLKAHHLYPDLEGLPQLSAVLDVHIVAQQKLDGVEVDWYGILQTDWRADEATIRKQYRKLALILHPDKNKAAGAEGAFKLISEAWRVLSDKERKAAHDVKRMVKRNNAPGSSAVKPTNGFRNFWHFKTWYQTSQGDQKSSFWTGCPACKMQFEYLRVHENKNISCPTCGIFFTAVEIQATGSTPSSSWDRVSKEAGSTGCSDKQTDKARSAHVGSSFSSRWVNLKYPAGNQKAAAKVTAEMVHETYETVRRERVRAQREAREKAAMERMEADREARRRWHQERKQKRKQEQQERLSKAIRSGSGSPRKGLGKEATHVNGVQSRRADSVNVTSTDAVGSSSRTGGAVNCVSTEDAENGMVHESPCDADNGTQELDSLVRERVARHVQEPFRCRTLNTYDSPNSYDSSELLCFSKRLKVDV